MRLVCVWILFLLPNVIQSQFYQNIYDIEHERIDVLKYNRSFVRNVRFDLVSVKGTHLKALNASGIFLIAVERNLMIKVTIFRLVGNTYRTFPLNVTVDACDINNRNILGLKKLFNHTNVRECPGPKGLVYLKNYVIEQEKLPPYLPLGKYKLFFDIVANGGYVLGNGNWYGGLVPKSF